MKKVQLVVLVALLAMIVGGNAACSLFSKSSPTATLKAFYDASKNKDVATVKKHLSKKSLELFETEAKKSDKPLDEFIKEAVAEPGSGAEKTPEFRNEKISGDTATVEMKRDQSDQWDTVPFVKEDGEWKLDFDRLVAVPAASPAGATK